MTLLTSPFSNLRQYILVALLPALWTFVALLRYVLRNCVFRFSSQWTVPQKGWTSTDDMACLIGSHWLQLADFLVPTPRAPYPHTTIADGVFYRTALQTPTMGIESHKLFVETLVHANVRCRLLPFLQRVFFARKLVLQPRMSKLDSNSEASLTLAISAHRQDYETNPLVSF